MDNVKRRDFGKLAVAAFGGLAVGASSREAAADDDKAPKIPVDPALLLKDPHVCRGLNVCKGHGAGGKNECAGRGQCASVKHVCAGENECKGQGGCGGYPGQNNVCKGQGHCAVPLDAETWEIARIQFEEIMEANGKKVGKAPKAKK